jgi:hypothetical protein
MLGAPASGFGGFASPEGLADSHGMGYGDTAGGMGGGYNSFMRGLIEAYSRFYGGNSSLLGHNRSVFGGPMISSGQVDTQGVPTDANPGGYLPGPVSNTPHNSQLTTVDIRDPNRNTPHNSQLGSVDLTGGPPRNDYGFLANNANILGLGPNYNGIGMDFGGMTPGNSNGGLMSDGGGERPWWLEGTNNGMGMGMMNPATGGWNDWDAPYTGTWPPNNIPPQLEVNPGMPGFPQGPPKRPNPGNAIIDYPAGYRPKPKRRMYGDWEGGEAA